MEKNFNSLDIGKFCMAFFVIAIHTHPFEFLNLPVFVMGLYDLICSCAVPFFFLTTGYLLARKLRKNSDFNIKSNIVKKSLKKTFRLYIIWSIVYIPLALYEYSHIYKELLGSRILYDIVSYIHGLIFRGEHFNSWILWYLLSSIYALMMIYFLVKKGKSIKYITIIGGVVFIIGIVMTDLVNTTSSLRYYESFLQKLIQHTFYNGRLTIGFLYIPLGMLLYDIVLSKKKASICILIGIILTFLGLKDWFMISNFITVLTSVGIFILLLNIHLKESDIYVKLRTISMIIYFMHMWIYSLYCMFIYKNMSFGMDCFVGTSLITFIIAIVYVKYKYREINN